MGGACLEATDADILVFETPFCYAYLPAKKGVLPVTLPFPALSEFLKLFPRLVSSGEAKNFVQKSFPKRYNGLATLGNDLPSTYVSLDCKEV